MIGAQSVALVIALVLTVILANRSFTQEAPPKDFTQLFNGKDLSGFKFVMREDSDPTKTWFVKDGMIICIGKPYGLIYTEKSFSNYVLRFGWRFARPDDLPEDVPFDGKGGLLLHIQDEPVVWPKCVEVQGRYSEYGKIFGMGTKIIEENFDKEIQRKVLKPVGEWNITEVTCRDGTIECKLNGKIISTGKAELKSGPFGWQSEGAETHFRDIWIKELK